MLSSSCFRIPSPELSAAAVLETTINTAVYAQQYVRYTKNETIAAAAAAAAAAARSSSNSKPSNLGNKQSSLSPASRTTPDPIPRQHRSHPTHHHHRCYHCRSEAPQLALVELATLPRDCRRTPTDWSW